MRSGGEQDDGAGVVLDLRRELLYEQERRADVLVYERVDVLGRQLAETPVAAPRVVDDEDVQGAERIARGGDDACRRIGVREVSLEIWLVIVAAPRERLVVRRPPLREDPRTSAPQPRGDRKADPPAARNAGDECVFQLTW